MFGLGLYIYAGEDLPESDSGNVASKTTTNNDTYKPTPNRYDSSKNGTVNYAKSQSISEATITKVKNLKRDGKVGKDVLYEAEKIKRELQEFEHDLWEY